LAKQLGRWAHIYYTATVDKREEAIEKLVCELEAEEARLSGGVTTTPVAGPEVAPQSTDTPRIKLVTGQPMEVAAQGPAASEDPRIADPGIANAGIANAGVVNSRSEGQSVPASPLQARREIEERVEATRDTVPESWQELLRSPGSAPPRERRKDQWQPPYAREEETTFVHPEAGSYVSRDAVPYSHSFDDLLAKSEQIELLQPSTGGWRRPFIAVVVLAVLGGSVWMVQSRRFPPGAAGKAQAPAVQQPAAAPPVAQAPVAQAPVAQAPAAQAPGAQPPNAQPPSAQPPNAQPAGVQAAGASPSALAPSQTPVQSPAFKASQANTGSPNHGQSNGATFARGLSPQTPSSGDTNPQSDPDLEAGLRALQGPQRNSAEAARHLWQSVKNKNSSALIPLAGLYARGDGVSKDCDQAKILLDAATRQAKSHTEFLRMEMIRADLRTSGCE